MWLIGLALVPTAFSYLVSTDSASPLRCAGQNGAKKEECQQPLKPVTTITPGSFYVAKLPCLDCPILQYSKGSQKTKHSVTKAENDLFFNISLTSDNRTLLLNDKPIFPAFPLDPVPPTIVPVQIAPNFSYADLDATLACMKAPCEKSDGSCSCFKNNASTVNLDYDYYSHWLESHPETQTEKWEITFDAIGGSYGYPDVPTYEFNSTEQYMLRIILEGKEIEGERYPGEKDLQAASSLFGALQESESLYEYMIASVEFMERRHTYQYPQGLSFMGRIRRFFGMDVMLEDGHIICIDKEWGPYGKKGSLRNHLGHIIHDWPWDMVFIILGCVAGGFVGAWGAYKLFFLIRHQRELMRWEGMDAVWARMRHDRSDEAEDRLLDGGYRDDPDEGRSSRYTDDVATNKPLPSKPLPEKPLPAVPLIDA